jgi:hypothetical protein
VTADLLFDFRPRRVHIGAEERKFSKSALEALLDVLVQGRMTTRSVPARCWPPIRTRGRCGRWRRRSTTT